MLSQHFIFSENRRDRILRHLLYWLVWGSYFVILHIASPMLKPVAPHFINVPFPVAEGILFLLLQAPITYITLYFILPIYLKERKLVKTIAWFIVCWGIYYFIYQYALQYVVPKILDWVLPEKYLLGTQRTADVRYFQGILGVFLGGFSSTAFIAGFKYVKQWHLKEQRNIQLQKENTESQLQLLTAQVHPHFLFNTLNNIYSQTQTESPKGSKMIMELSGMLRYILAEGNKARVPLQKELAMTQDYIHLEKIRYGNKLDLHVSIPDDTDNLEIAPLILLPFVENCFKHGASKFLKSPWINLQIEMNGRKLIMKLMNGKASDLPPVHPHSGTGINNVKKRLELLYPDKHQLQITDEPEVFVVNLSLELTESKPKSTIQDPTTTFNYV